MGYDITWTETGTVYVSGCVDTRNATRFLEQMKALVCGHRLDLSGLEVRDRAGDLALRQLLLEAAEFGGEIRGAGYDDPDTHRAS